VSLEEFVDFSDGGCCSGPSVNPVRAVESDVLAPIVASFYVSKKLRIVKENVLVEAVKEQYRARNALWSQGFRIARSECLFPKRVVRVKEIDNNFVLGARHILLV
jgi:hypothetical protein